MICLGETGIMQANSKQYLCKTKKCMPYVRFDVFAVVKIEVKVFAVVMLCSAPVEYHHFGGPPKCWYPTTVLYNITTL